jgi:phage-related baseplate assembly protein
MSRNTEYEFVDIGTESLESYLVNIYEALTGTTVQPSSPEMLFIKWVSSVILQERNLLNYAANQNLPSRAEGENLDALAELFYAQERPAATPAVCTVRFHISEAQERLVLIPAGTRCTDTSQTLYWMTQADAYIPIGDTYADVHVECAESGTIGNGYAIGQINSIVDVYDYYSGCENITESDTGTDEMSDDDFYEMLRLSMDAMSTAGAHGNYVYHALSVSTEIADVVVNSPNPGEIRIYVLMDDGTIATTEGKAAVLEMCSAEDKRPLTDHVLVEDPEPVGYNIDLTYYIPSNQSSSSASIIADVQAAVEEYTAWQAGKLGRDINPSKLIDLMMHTGIKRVEVREPVFTQLQDGNLSTEDSLPLAQTIPQIATVGTITLVNGGVENE